MSESNREQISILKEAVLGTTPAGNGTIIPFSSHSLVANRGTKMDASVDGGRDRKAQLSVSKGASGGIELYVRNDIIGPLLRAALFAGADSPAGTFKNADTRWSYSIERKFNDVASVFLSYLGMVINTLTIRVNSRTEVSVAIEFLGKDNDSDTATIFDAYDTLTTDPIFVAGLNVSSMTEGGSPIATGVQSLEITFNNNLRERPDILDDNPVDIKGGFFDVSGTITPYFATKALYDKAKSGTESAIVLGLTDDDANVITITLPKVKYRESNPGNPGENSDVMLPMPFDAYYDSGIGATVQIVES